MNGSEPNRMTVMERRQGHMCVVAMHKTGKSVGQNRLQIDGGETEDKSFEMLYKLHQ